VRCPRLQFGTPSCACWVELVPLTGVSDHAGICTRRQKRSRCPSTSRRRPTWCRWPSPTSATGRPS
jgi:hypothetical protein